MTSKRIISLLLVFIMDESIGQDNKKREYYQTFPITYNPETLTAKCAKADLKYLTTYFIAYRNKSKQVRKIEQMKGAKLINSFIYTYKAGKLSKIIQLMYENNVSDKCQIDFTDTHRHTRCYYKGGALYTEEWYEIVTTSYHFGQYDEHGNLIHAEYGSYSPKQ